MKGELHIPIQDLMDQFCLEGEKIERRISCTYSGLDRSDLFLTRENWKENFMHLFRTWWVRSIFKETKFKGEFHALFQDLMGQIYFSGEKIERKISCTYSRLDGSDLSLSRKNWEENFMYLFKSWWVISIYK